jgi:membrane protease YdiL (CAAX protease family)
VGRSLKRHPVTVLLVLVYAFTWVVWVPRAMGADLGWVALAWTWAPAVAAVVAAAVTGGRPALRALGSRMTRWRVNWRWYVVVILGPAAFSLVVAAVFVALGGSWSSATPRVLTEALPLLPLFLLLLAVTDGLGEEPAWRGFALPRMLAGSNALIASLVLGVFWALWHLPLLWTPGAVSVQQLPWWLLLLDVPAKSVFFTWVFLRTRGSAFLSVLLHGSSNLFTVSPSVATAGTLLLPLIATAAKWLLVLILVAIAGTSLTRRPSPEAMPSEAEEQQPQLL